MQRGFNVNTEHHAKGQVLTLLYLGYNLLWDWKGQKTKASLKILVGVLS